jgi:drug/metabolite transporter (DMT)-like permease
MKAFFSSVPIRFALWMNGSFLCFAALIALVRYLSETHGMDIFVMSFWRNLFSILIFLPWLISNGLSAAHTRNHGRLFWRAALMVVSSTAMFFAAALMPLAEATAISFTTPLFTVILAVIFLREYIGPRRIVAIAIGLIGVVIILRPGTAVLNPAAIFPLLSALSFGAVVVLSKQLAGRVSAAAIGLWLAIYMIPISALPLPFVWETPTWEQLLWLIALGAVAAGNMYCISRALRIGEASQTAPWDFARLPYVALFGFLWFGQKPEIWTWIGGAVIFASVLYVTWREARLAKGKGPSTSTEKSS